MKRAHGRRENEVKLNLNFIFYLSVRNGYNVKTKIPDLKS
jgi:hypothetical protein